MEDKKLENSEKKEKISQRAFERIKKEEIKMLPKCYFEMKSLIFLMLSGVCFFLASFFISIVLDYFYSHRFFQMVFYLPTWTIMAFPYLSFFIAFIALILAFWTYRKSRCVCRHENWIVSTFFAFSALILGAVASFSVVDFTKSPFYLPKESVKSATFYHRLSIPEKKFWSNPDRGTLSGILIDNSNESWIVKDWNGRTWVIVRTGESKVHLQFEKSLLVKSFGRRKENNIFTAHELWRW